MSRRTNSPHWSLCFEMLEQKRPLATNVVTCGEADPEALVADEGGDSQQTANSAAQLNSLTHDTQTFDTAATDEDSKLKNEEISDDQSDVEGSTELQDDDEDDDAMENLGEDVDGDEADDPEEDSSEDDDDAMTDDDIDEDDDDSEDQDGDDVTSDDEDEDESMDEDDNESMDDEGDDSMDDEDESMDDEVTDDDDDSTDDDDDSMDDEVDSTDLEDDEDNDGGNSEESVQSGGELRAAQDGGDETSVASGSESSRDNSTLIGLGDVFENGSQGISSVKSDSRQLVSPGNNSALLQLLTASPRNNRREMALDTTDERVGRDLIEASGPSTNDEMSATLQGPLQPALVDAVFTSLG